MKSYYYFLFLVPLSSTLVAQETPSVEQPPVVVAPPVTPVVTEINEEMVTLQLPNNPIGDILERYQQLTGKRLIKDAALNQQGLNLTIVGPSMPKSEAIRMIEAALLLNGFAFVPGPDNSLKAINVAGGQKNPRAEGVPLYASLSSLPVGEQVVSYFMALRYLNANDAMTIFTSQIQLGLHPYSSVVPVPNAQAVVITDNVPVIRHLVALQELIDIPPAKISREFVTLERADAERVAETITKLLDTRRAGAPAPPQGGGAPAAAPGTGGLVSGDTQLVADPRTNRILVVTQPINIDYLKDLIQQFDMPADVTAPLEFPLNYAKADEVLETLRDVLTETTTGPQGGAQAAPRPGGQAGGGAAAARAGGGAAGGAGGGTGSGATTEIQVPEDNTVPRSLIVGKTKLIADNKANSILVIGPPESKERVKDILTRLDKKPLQVHLAVVIGQLTLGDNSEFGIDILKKFSEIRNGGIAVGQRNRSGIADLVPEPSDLVSSGLFPLPTGLTIYGAIGSQINAYVKALEGSNKFTVLSRPSVYTANNKLATIRSGTEIPVPDQTVSSLNAGTTNNSSVTASVNFKRVELRLDVVPQINAAKEVNLRVRQTNDSVTGNNAVVGGNVIPVIANQELNTTITVANQETVVLGGLVTDNKTQTVTGLPWISRIPLIGLLFKDTQKSNSRSELIVLIQPTVIEELDEERALTAKEKGRVVVGPDAQKYVDQPKTPPRDQTQRPFFLPRNEKKLP